MLDLRPWLRSVRTVPSSVARRVARRSVAVLRAPRAWRCSRSAAALHVPRKLGVESVARGGEPGTMTRWLRMVGTSPRAKCIYARAAVLRRDSVAMQLRRTERLWRHVEMTCGMLTIGQVLERTGGEAVSAEAHMAELHHQGLLKVLRDGRPLYPSWQLIKEAASSQAAVVHPAWRDAQAALRAAGWSPDEIVLWACSPTGRLSGRACPAARLREEPSKVVEVAHAMAAASDG